MKNTAKVGGSALLLILLPHCEPERDAGDAGVSKPPSSSGAGGADSASSGSCFSPTQNLDTVDGPGAIGCDCVPTNAVHPEASGECVPDSQGDLVALLCLDGRWRAVEDGPCIPYFLELSRCFSPEANLDRAYQAHAIGCKCDTQTDEDVCVADGTGRDVALICEHSRWQAVEDGPCRPGS